MNEDLKKIGEMFKGKREELHLSLKEVENATSIRMMYLQAIEEGDVNKFLAHVYTLGFVKQYASFLGYDADRIIQEHPKAFLSSKMKQDFDYGIGTLEVRGTPSGGVRWLPNAVWIVGAGIILIFAWYLIKSLGIL